MRTRVCRLWLCAVRIVFIQARRNIFNIMKQNLNKARLIAGSLLPEPIGVRVEGYL